MHNREVPNEELEILKSTKTNWKLREKALNEIKNFIMKSENEEVAINIIENHFEKLAVQFKDLRYYLKNRSSAVKNASEFLRFCSSHFDSRISKFVSLILEKSDILYTLGSSNKSKG